MSILQQLEHRLKINVREHAKNSSLLVVGSFIAAIFGLGVNILFANTLSKEVFGEYRFILGLFNTFNSFALSGMNIAVVQAVARGHEGALASSIRYQLKWAIPHAIGGFIAASFFYAQGDKIQGVFTPNENTSLGVLAELKRIKRAGKIVHIGFDYNDYLHDALTQGFITGLILQQPFEIGYRSVMQAQQAVRGVARPTEPIHTGTMYLHQGNMNSAATKTFLELNTAYGGTHPKSAP